MSLNRWAAVLSASWLLSVSLYAQTNLPTLPLSQLTLPAGWQLVGSVSTGADGRSLKTQPGNTIAVGATEPLTLLKPTEDFRLRFELLTTPGADVMLTLPAGQPISLNHSADIPRLLKAPGLWQTVEIFYKTGFPKGQPILEKLIINGIIVREGQLLSGKPSPAVTLMDTKSTVAVRNVGYRFLKTIDVARWDGPLTYEVYENKDVSKREDLTGQKVLKKDTTSLINYEVAYGLSRQFAILFSGKLNALQTSDYQFELNQGGIAGLWVDGKEIVPTAYHELGQPTTGQASLTAGLHDVQVLFVRSWPRPGLGVFVSQAGTRQQPLHALASLPDPAPVSLLGVYADTKPQLIRSFVQLPTESKKRTHTLSVGSPAGLHYTLDLNQMALLQAWKGDFANATEMWHERGEPQLLSPLGPTIYLPAQTALMVLADESTAWPDSVQENTLQYKGFVLDKQGFPTIEYGLTGATVTDAVRSGTDGLDRTLTLTGSPNGTLYCRAAAGSLVEEVSKGLYAIDDRSYYVRIDPKAKVKVRQSNGKQEILLPVIMKNGAGTVQYSIVF